ncbi:MAG: peptidase inhibitor family I36 protein [Marmoricola sp.]
MRRIAATLAVAVAAASAVLAGTGSSTASVPQAQASPSIASLVAAQLARRPGGTVVGGTVRYDDGSTFVAKPALGIGTYDCKPGNFCGWYNTNYSGSMYTASGTGTKAWGFTTRSYYNHRTTAARLPTNSGALSTCFTSGHMVGSALSTYQLPQHVYLYSTTRCP